MYDYAKRAVSHITRCKELIEDGYSPEYVAKVCQNQIDSFKEVTDIDLLEPINMLKNYMKNKLKVMINE